MSSILIRNATIVNEGETFRGDLLIKDEIISVIGPAGQLDFPKGSQIIDASGLFLIPGVIDVHVHFREPGLTHKGDIITESRAAAPRRHVIYGYAQYCSANYNNKRA